MTVGIEMDPVARDIMIVSEYREKDLVKQVPGTHWDKDAKMWRAPLSWATCVAFRGIFGDALVIGDELRSWAFSQREWIDRAMQLRTVLQSDGIQALHPNLYEFQAAGVDFLTTARQALIADEMGTGKTIQLISAVAQLQYEVENVDKEQPSPFPVLVVAPNSMKLTWEKEWKKWDAASRVIVIQGGAVARRKQLEQVKAGEYDVAIINWEALRLHSRLEGYGNMRLKRCTAHGGADPKVKDTACEAHPKELNEIDWGTVIADEAHKAKDPKAKQSRALWAVGIPAPYRFAATGTPIANQPGELWSLMHFVAPTDFPSKTRFVDRYCLQSWNAFGGMDIVGLNPHTVDEFRRIVEPRMIRRLKSVVLPYLPEKTYTNRYVEMTPKQAKAYGAMEANMIAALDDGDVVYATNPLAQLTRLSQFASAYAEVGEDGNIRLLEPSCKVDALMEILEESGDEQVVVFAESRQLIEVAAAKVEKAGYSYGLLTGAISTDERQRNIDQFQDGKLKVMLVTLGAGGEGITLTAASVAVFLQRSWSLVKNKQAEDRIHRPGQTAEKVEIIDLTTVGTIEERRLDMLADKEDRLQEVVRDADTIRKLLGQ